MPDDGLVPRLMLFAFLSVGVTGGVCSLILYATGRAMRQRLLPPVRSPRQGWPGIAVAGAFVLFAFFNLGTSIIHSALVSLGFFRAVYGADFPVDNPIDPNARQLAAKTIRLLWSTAFAFPMQVAAMVWLARWLQVPSPFRFGGWRMNVVAGYLTWLIVTPAAFCVFVVAIVLHVRLTGLPPEKHPLTALGEMAGSWEWGLFVLQTVLIAPILEEWLFRGVLLHWLANSKPRPPATMPLNHRSWVVIVASAGVAWFLAFVTRPVDLVAAFQKEPQATLATYLFPGAFVLVLLPLDWTLPRWSRFRRHLRLRSPQQVRAVIASSALFAAFHAGVWPSPVPLVVLSIGIGYLYLRTRSLVGPIIVHGLFNAVSAAYMLLGGPV